jgi:hypothetical protein
MRETVAVLTAMITVKMPSVIAIETIERANPKDTTTIFQETVDKVAAEAVLFCKMMENDVRRLGRNGRNDQPGTEGQNHQNANDMHISENKYKTPGCKVKGIIRVWIQMKCSKNEMNRIPGETESYAFLSLLP